MLLTLIEHEALEQHSEKGDQAKQREDKATQGANIAPLQ
jgi:hypothetical protein